MAPKFHVLTLFPEMIMGGLSPSIIGRAGERGMIFLNAVDIRAYTRDRHGSVDDYPYGGGAGMLMQAQPVYDAWKATAGNRKVRTIYVTPQGAPFCQKMAEELAAEEELIFLCGHYEGVDERVLEEIVTDYVSIGDYVLTGGELAAMVMIDAIARLVPGVLGNDASSEEESFYNDLLEYPQYSRPEVWHEKSVPRVLLSGDHGKVAAWRLEESKRRTASRRPDLYAKYQRRQKLIERLLEDKRNNIHMIESLSRGRGEILYWEGGNVLIYDKKSGVGMAAASEETGVVKIAELIPEETEFVMSSREAVNRALKDRGYRVSCVTSQFVYTEKAPLPVRHKDIRQLGMEYLDYIGTRQEYIGRQYAAACIERGSIYGAFVNGRLAGFVGMRREGGIGLLYVDEEYRGMGVAKSLEAFMLNRCIAKGWTPYGHVVCGDRAAERLQESLGLYKARNEIWWLKVFDA